MARETARISPPRTSAAQSFRASAISFGRLISPEDLARNDHALNFAGAFADGAQLYVAVKLLRRIVLDESVSAKHLHRLVGHAHRNFAGVELGHARLAREAQTRVAGGSFVGQPRRAVNQHARRG